MEIKIEQLLNLSFLRVEKVEITNQKLEVHCESETPVGICPNCLRSCTKVFKYYERRVQDMPVFGKKVYLHLRCRQFHCPDCNDYFSERFDFVDKTQKQTNRLQEYLYKMCESIPTKQVCLKEDLCWETVQRIYKKYSQKELNKGNLFRQVRYLGIDEISIKKGKRDYACVLVDLERGVVLDFLESRDKSFLINYFKEKGEVFCRQIEVLSSDMWNGFVNLVGEVFPNAINVLDRFHFFCHLNKVLDKERKALRKEYPFEESFKHLPWPLLRPEETLDEKDKKIVQQAFKKAPQLEKIYQLRNELRVIFDQQFNELQASMAIAFWQQRAMKLKNKYLNKFLKSLQYWRRKILNFFSFRLTNAVVEGINNHIRSIIRRSFGFRNFENLKTRILLEC